MTAVLEEHTQVVSRISRDDTSCEEAICLSLSLLDIMCPRGWKRDREAVGDSDGCSCTPTFGHFGL
eukprot:CAMPEP_0179410368 /NCGR_PEP_ID=MMETSP0799-20121207/3247_1 /TAXON_ID=46947 /ORGANISM="Geminigera cryophila, Strain CCMP2564" /LENGTH=65 /DNA_ID=CAMNT_0021182207 /DNA_START=392 /DNA_END=589 /DNA_ORIENTATION=-